MDDCERVISIREFCERFGICLATAYVHIRSGRLRARKMGRKTVFLPADVARFVESLPDFSAGQLKQFRKPTGPFAKPPARSGAAAAEQSS
jgi:excisionase family DNA binding protein